MLGSQRSWPIDVIAKDINLFDFLLLCLLRKASGILKIPCILPCRHPKWFPFVHSIPRSVVVYLGTSDAASPQPPPHILTHTHIR